MDKDKVDLTAEGMWDCKTDKFNCCTADDVADTMLSLILGNRFVTGEIIIIDGGFSSTT